MESFVDRLEEDDDQHTFLRQQEFVHLVGPGYLVGFGHSGLVCPSQRTALVDWMSLLHAATPVASGGGPPLSLETLFLAVNVFDRFASTYEGGVVVPGSLQVVGAACLGIASKYEDTQLVATSLWGLAGAWIQLEQLGFTGEDRQHAARKARKESIAAMEILVLSALSHRLTVPTALSFLGVFLRRASLLGFIPEGPAAETIRTLAHQILLRVLRDVTWLEHMPSVLAAAALHWAFSTWTPGAAPPCPFSFFAITGYQPEILFPCLLDMGAFEIWTPCAPQGAAPGAAMGVSGSVEPVLHYPSTQRGPCSVREVVTLPSQCFESPGRVCHSFRDKAVTGACGQCMAVCG